MPQKSKIEWTELTWNPTTGCNKVSAGCKFCYAERWAKMQKKRGIDQYKHGFKLTLAPGRLKEPYSWTKSHVVFVNSMSDLFHEAVPENYIKQVFNVMVETPQHTYQILTKRIDRVNELKGILPWPKNIWMGVSVESNSTLQRVNTLKDIPARKRFISFEPLLEKIEFVNLKRIHWVIVGGESGSKARELKLEWVLPLKETCRKEQVPFFFKQWGRKTFNPNKKDPTINKAHGNYAKGGCMIENKICKELPN